MNRRFVLAFAIGLGAVTGVGFLVGVGPTSPPALSINRYHIADQAGRGGAWVIDTATGRVWWLTADGQWIDRRQPPAGD